MGCSSSRGPTAVRASDGGVRNDEEAFPFPKEEDAPNNRLSEPVESIGGSKPDARPSDDEVKFGIVGRWHF